MKKLYLAPAVFLLFFYFPAAAQGALVSSFRFTDGYAAMLLPVSLPGCPKTFYLQFDLGSPHSLFYRNKLAAIRDRYPQSCPAPNTAGRLPDFPFKLDTTAFSARRMGRPGDPGGSGGVGIVQFDSSGIDWRPAAVEVIGTLGVDLISGKVLVIDYPLRRLMVREDWPEKELPEIRKADFMLVQDRVLLPAFIRGKRRLLYFDTGSSAFALLTDKPTWTELAARDAVASDYAVSSWGKELTAHTIATNDSVELAAQKIPIGQVTYIEGASALQVNQMLQMGIGGMTGNRLFVRGVLVLDLKHQQFGISGGG